MNFVLPWEETRSGSGFIKFHRRASGPLELTGALRPRPATLLANTKNIQRKISVFESNSFETTFLHKFVEAKLFEGQNLKLRYKSVIRAGILKHHF